MARGDGLVEIGETIAGAAQGRRGGRIRLGLGAGRPVAPRTPSGAGSGSSVSRPGEMTGLAQQPGRGRREQSDDRELDVPEWTASWYVAMSVCERPLGLLEAGEHRAAVLLPHRRRAIERHDDLRVLLPEVEHLLARYGARRPGASPASGVPVGRRRRPGVGRWRVTSGGKHDVLHAAHHGRRLSPTDEEDEPSLRSHEDVTSPWLTYALGQFARIAERRIARRAATGRRQRGPAASGEILHLGDSARCAGAAAGSLRPPARAAALSPSVSRVSMMQTVGLVAEQPRRESAPGSASRPRWPGAAGRADRAGRGLSGKPAFSALGPLALGQLRAASPGRSPCRPRASAALRLLVAFGGVLGRAGGCRPRDAGRCTPLARGAGGRDGAVRPLGPFQDPPACSRIMWPTTPDLDQSPRARRPRPAAARRPG